MDEDDTFYDVEGPEREDEEEDDDWGAWTLDNETSV